MTAGRPRLFRLYLRLVALAALVSIALDVEESVGHRPFGAEPAAFGVFALCCLFTELRPLRWLHLHESSEVTASWTFMLAMLLVGPPAAAVAGAAALFVIGDVRSRKAPEKVLFNASQLVIALTIGAWILRVTGAARDLAADDSVLSWWWLFAFGSAALSLFLVNSLLTCAVLAMQDRVPLRRTLREIGGATLSTDGVLLSLSPIFVIVATRSLLLVPLLLITTWAVYRTAALAHRRQYEADHDPLTGLPNRRMFDERLGKAIEIAQATGGPVGVVVFDLDDFKTINDRLGHQVGDHVLVDVAERLKAVRRPSDLVARFGGDEFALLITGADSKEAIVEQARRCLEVFDDDSVSLGFPIAVGSSLGVAVLPEDAADAETLLRHADEAMYRAKREHSGIAVYDAVPTDGRIGRISLLADLAEAVAGRQLFLEYQPQIDLVTGQLIGVEALVRWNHPRVGVLDPGMFMPLAEHTELIRPLTDWILGEALAQCAAWQRLGVALRIAVNASARDVQDPRLPEAVGALLATHGVPGECLELEITENALASRTSTLHSVLEGLQAMGVSISIDDFGTGYSSMTQLRDLPVDQIKIDRRFVSTMVTEDRNALIVEAIIRLGTSLGIETVAEGVENVATVDRLRTLGCNTLQGFLFGRPVPARDITELARRAAAGIPAMVVAARPTP